MSKILVYVGIAVLAIIAVVMGYQIYEQTTVIKPPPIQQTQDTSVPQTVGNQQTPQPNTQFSSQSEYSEILNFDDGSATKEEKRIWYNSIGRLTKGTDTLDISMCKPNPVVVKLNQNTQLKVTNNDNRDRMILRGDLRYTIPAKQTSTISIKDWGVGILRYRCNTDDGSGAIVGILKIE